MDDSSQVLNVTVDTIPATPTTIPTGTHPTMFADTVYAYVQASDSSSDYSVSVTWFNGSTSVTQAFTPGSNGVTQIALPMNAGGYDPAISVSIDPGIGSPDFNIYDIHSAPPPSIDFPNDPTPPPDWMGPTPDIPAQLYQHGSAAPAPFITGPVETDFATAQSTYSPLVLDLSSDGSGITLAALNSAGSIYWDSGSGIKNASGWVTGTTGLLCIDPTSSGVITQADLFGNTATASNGFLSLQSFAGTTGILDSSNSVFSELRVWIPTDNTGISSSSQLHTLASLGITSIDLGYSTEDYQIAGNTIDAQSTFVIDGNTQTIADAWFASDLVNTMYNGSYTISGETVFLPDQRGYGDLPNLAISMSLDSTLLGEVQSIASQTASQLLDPTFNLESTLQTILFEWAGVTGVGANPDSPYFNTALQQQELAFLEQLMGQPYHDGSGYVNVYAAYDLAETWNAAFSYIAGHILGQAGFGDLMGVPLYDLTSDTFSVGGSSYDVAVQFADQALPGQPLEHLATNDIFVLEPGDAPLSSGSPTLLISETASGGGTNSVLIGASPSAATMWDDHYGNVYLQYSSTDVVEITAAANSSGATLVDQYIQQVVFEDGTTWNFADGLNLTAANDYQALYGSSTGGDTLTATGAYNTLNAFGGTETLVAAGTATTINNGTGTDTDVFSAGTAPISSGGDLVYANTSGGTGIIDLHGIAPSAVTMWDNFYGDIMIKFSSTDEVIVYGGSFSWSTGLTLNGLNEVTFDSGYATTWDLSTGLNLTAPNDYQLLFGTVSGGDTLTAGGTGDSLYAFGGTETLVAGPGANLYNGTGNDTDVINAGSSPSSNPATINANSSGGSDNVILLHDVVASDIAISDTSSGNLIIDTPTDHVIVSGGSFSWTTGFAVGNIDHIALDSGSPISLTGGLNLTALHDSQSLYGTGHGDNLTAAGNYDNLFGIAGNNTMTGNSSSSATTNFYGGSGNDLMIAEGGTNYMNAGTGADTYSIANASSSTTVTGFSEAKGDVLSFESILEGTSVLSNVGNYVQETTSGGNTQFSVDPTGTANFTAGPLVTLSGVTGLEDVATMIAHGHLLVHS